ncbi:MAG: prolipoprotein diacylglyceryl transferase, partial [Chitinophagales bacterium]|nr:prolipoprotein diacylglyceryl transferase [Chitinophagales bacterium]
EAIGLNFSLPFFTFGLFVALAFFVGAYILLLELKRKEKEGLLHPVKQKVVMGEAPKPVAIIMNAIFGFIIGFKFVAAAMDWKTFSENPQVFLFSGTGNAAGGILFAGLLGYLKYREGKKQQLPKPEIKTVEVYPHQRIGDIVAIAAVAGIAGAKIFSNFEEPDGWKDFLADPLGNFFSGLTIYGGLLLGAASVIYYATRKKINVLHLGDSFAPALILAYGIGRIGCQVSGDGDWGIYNSAYITNPNGEITLAQNDDFESSLQKNAAYYIHEFGAIESVPHKYFKAPSFIPRSFVAQNYAHNVNEDGITLPDCDEMKCAVLPTPVFPTPIYETIMCTILFSILWVLRKKWKIPGMLFAFYIVLTGVERYLIETIRVNNVLTFLGIQATQATFISVALILFGLGFMLVLRLKRKSAMRN